MQTKKLFLASSSGLKENREQFENFIGRENKDRVDKGVFIENVIWKDFVDAMSKTRLQDESDKTIEDCDLNNYKKAKAAMILAWRPGAGASPPSAPPSGPRLLKRRQVHAE